MFDKEILTNDLIVVQCKTEDQAIELLQWAFKNGKSWDKDTPKNFIGWDRDKEYTGYSLGCEDNYITFGNVSNKEEWVHPSIFMSYEDALCK